MKLDTQDARYLGQIWKHELLKLDLTIAIATGFVNWASNQIDFKEGSRGQTINLTIDTEIQKLTSDLLRDKAGSISVMDIYTGDIIAMNSSPSFDPNLFLYGIDE